jgi:4-hydroxybenzoate polyprenyltransferase
MLSKPLEKLLDYTKLVEIGALQVWLASLVLGVFFATETFHAGTGLLRLSEGFFGLFLILCYVMVINDYCDIGIDRLKSQFTEGIDKSILAKKGQIIGGVISITEARVSIVFTLVAGLSLSFLASVNVLFVNLLIVLLGTLYSVPPIRFKKVYPLSTIGDIAGGALPFLSGYAIISAVSIEAIAVSMISLLICAYHRLRHEILMVEFDRVTEKKTIGVVHGTRTANIVRRICPILISFEIMAMYFTGLFTSDFWLALFLFLFLSFGFWGPLLPKSAKKVFGGLWSFAFAIIIAVTILYF